ncbi:MAG: serine/threonine-protein kinase, partial [Thermoanaerobaculia bacterium]|nr:serine/threonine-protein kinase [Thermoanaerobaculia bacterium]
LSDNPAFRQRFETEAKMISQLSHPHICALYDVGNQDGVEYLVMEFLEGETLTDRIAKGPLPLEMVLRYGIEISDALEKAHRQGIVHRDLKPGNVMLTKSGIKLVDFGLAKVALPAPGSVVSSHSVLPTQAEVGLTAQGTFLGTFQYMAPEQLEGGEADGRTDIFALGLLLFEMTTGQKAFSGKTEAAVMVAIMHNEPPSVSSAKPMTPPALDRVVKTCLAKDPNDRFQTAHDVKLQLQWIAEGGSGAGVAAPVAARRKSRERLAWALVPLAALAASAATVLVIRLRSEPPRVILSSLLPPEKSSFSFEFGPMALSPDGRRVAFVATSSGINMLWVQPLSGVSAQPLAGTEGASNPFWSPDSRFLGFFANRKLKKIEASGGAPQTLADASLGRGGSWNREGVILFVPNSREVVHRVSASGGEASPVTKLDAGASELSHRWPVFLPDGRRFLYLAQNSLGAGEKNGIYAASLDGGERKLLFNANTNVAYTPPGHLLFYRERTLLARAFDPKSLRFTEEAFPVAEDVQYFATFAQAVFAASDQGLLAYQTGVSGGRTQLTWLDRAGKPAGTVGAPGHLATPRMSNDGRRVAVRILDPQAVGDIWIYDLERNTRTRFTFDPSDDFGPLWSHDDSRVVFSSARKSPGDIYQRDSAGTAKEEPLLSSNAFEMALDWSPDGRVLLFQVDDPRTKNQMDLWTYSAADGKATPFLQSAFNEILGRFSPDGRWIAYVSNESGKEEVYVVPFPGPGGKWQISTAGGRAPLWTRGGREIIYQAPGDEIMAVEVRAAPTFQAGIPKALFKTHLRPPPGGQFDVTPDGERFLVNLRPAEEISDPVTLVQNWAEERKRR